MASFFDQLSERISSVSKDGINKAKELKDTAKYNVNIKTEEGNISRLYKELGRAYYEDHKDDETPDYSVVGDIKAAFERIRENQEEIARIRGARKCPECGKDVGVDAKFCPFCGVKLPVIEVEPEEEEAAEDFTEAEDIFEEESAAEKFEEVEEAAEEKVCEAEEAAEEACCSAEEAAKEGCCQAEEAAEEACECAEEAAEEAKEAVEEAAEEAKEACEDTKDAVKEAVEGTCECAKEAAAEAAVVVEEVFGEVKETVSEVLKDVFDGSKE